MKTFLFLLAALMTFSLSAAVQAEEKAAVHPDETILVIEKKPRAVSIPKAYGSSRLQDWFVLDSRHLIIEVTGGKKYKATLMNACTGLRFTDSIGFSTMGPFELDKWTTILLPGGERCYIKELTPYDEDAAKDGNAKDRK